MADDQWSARGNHDGGDARNERALRRRRQIIDAALTVMERDGFHRASMQAIADAAGISVGLIYQYVANKDDLLSLVILGVVEEYQAQLPGATRGLDDPVDKLAAMFTAYVELIDHRRRATQLAYRESHALPPAALRQAMEVELGAVGLFRDVIDEADQAGLLCIDDAELVAYDLVMAAHAWALKHWYYSRRMTLDAYRARQLSLILGGAIRPEHRDRYRTALGS